MADGAEELVLMRSLSDNLSKLLSALENYPPVAVGGYPSKLMNEIELTAKAIREQAEILRDRWQASGREERLAKAGVLDDLFPDRKIANLVRAIETLESENELLRIKIQSFKDGVARLVGETANSFFI